MAVPTWIPVAVNLPGDSKSIALEIKLGIERAWSFVAQLWFEAAKYHQDGRIEGPNAAALVARRAGWPHDPEKFVRAMVEARWLDETPEGFRIHDWEKHTGAHIQRLEEERQKVREWRAAKKAQRAAAKADGNGNRTGTETVTKPEPYPDVTPTVPDKREMERERERDIPLQAAPSPSDSPPPPADDSPVVATLPCVGSGPKDYPVRLAQVTAWQVAYPGVDVLAEVRKALAWLEANPAKRKTHRGCPAFLVNWLNRAQDRGGPARGVDPPAKRNHGMLPVGQKFEGKPW